MQNQSFRNMLVLAAAAGASLIAGAAHAVVTPLTLTLSEPGFTPVTITDTLNTGETQTNYISFGTFHGNIDVATSNKLTPPTPSQVTLQITGLLTSNSGGGTLTITTNDSGFSFPGTIGSLENMDSVAGGTLAPSTAGDTVTFQSIATANSGVAASNVSAGVQSFTSPGITPGTLSFRDPSALNVTFTQGSGFDLTNIFTVTLGAANEQANLSGTTTVALAPVPEPTTGLAMIAGVGGMALRRRRMI